MRKSTNDNSCEKFQNQPDFFELDQSVGLSCNNPLTVLAN